MRCLNLLALPWLRLLHWVALFPCSFGIALQAVDARPLGERGSSTAEADLKELFARAEASARARDGAIGTCALNQSAACPLPPWPPTYNLTQSSIMYQPWCINDGEPDICTGLLNISSWWAKHRDEGSVGEAHWGLLGIDDSTSTQMWGATTYGGATPGNPLTFRAQKAMLDNCKHVKGNGWVDRCMVYDNNVVSLGWYETHRAKMMDTSFWPMFNTMGNHNASSGVANYSGLPMLEPLGTLTPCWKFPNHTALGPTPKGVAQHGWCGLPGLNGTDIRLPCFGKTGKDSCDLSQNPRAGGGEGFSYYWNFSAPGVAEWRVRDNLEFVLNGSDSVDGLFTDEMEMFPGDGGDAILDILGASREDAQAQQHAAQVAHQQQIDSLVKEGKYLWQAFQAANNVGGNTNNNSNGYGGTSFDVEHCAQWMTQRCNTEWVNKRAITVQFDSANVNVSIASFLIVRPEYAWLGYGAGYLQPKWNDAFLWDVGEPRGECRNGSVRNTFERSWTYGLATMDCNTYSATVPCNPADRRCGKVPLPPPPPPPPPPPTPSPGPSPPGPSPSPPAPIPRPGKGWSAAHNCTSCQTPPAKPLLPERSNLSFNECQALCVSHPQCRYINWVEPATKGECTLWSDCGELCLTDHCWHWWVTYEYLDRTEASGRAWNDTACDSLLEKPAP